MAEQSARVDIVILTVLPEEFTAMRRCLRAPRSATSLPARLNRYAWEIGEIPLRGAEQVFTVALGMLGQAGTVAGALAARDACDIWNPDYLFFVGIAGGFAVDGITNGDVVISNMIYGYEYGKIDRDFHPRNHLTFKADISLLNKALSFADKGDGSWLEESPVYFEEFRPNVKKGDIASGDKVIDSPGHDFFAQVLRAFGRIHAVEMEGAGVAAAIDQIKDRSVVRFLMIRGISDMPRASSGEEPRGTEERDLWKKRAALAAAAFTAAFIADGLLAPPQQVASAEQVAPADQNLQKHGDLRQKLQPQESTADQQKANISSNVNVSGRHNNVYNYFYHGPDIVTMSVVVIVVLGVSLLLYWVVSRSAGLQIAANAPTLLPTAVPTPPPTATPDAPLQSALRWNVVVSDTFHNVSSSLAITRTIDKYADVQTSIVQDAYTLNISAPKGAIGWPIPYFMSVKTDSMVCIDAKKMKGAQNSSFLLMFHIKDYVDPSDPKNAYFFSIRVSPGMRTYRVDGHLREEDHFEQTFSVTSDAIHDRGVNRVCVLTQGSHFRYYINGTYVYENSTQSTSSGYINVAASLPPEGGEAIYQFDNLEIRAP